MGAMEHEGKLKLQVRDFGPIVEADVDLRPLTLFVGASNTGKSYLAILIYALQRLQKLREEHIEFNAWRFTRRKFALGKTNGAHGELRAWARAVTAGNSNVELTRQPLPDSAARSVRRALNVGSKLLSELAEYEFARCFGVANTDMLIRHSSRKASEIVLQRFVAEEQEKEEPFQHAFSLARGCPARVAPTIPKAKPLHLGRFGSRLSWMVRDLASEAAAHADGASRAGEAMTYVGIELALAEAVFPYVFGGDWNSSHYLPADRTGVMHAHQVVVGALLGLAAEAPSEKRLALPALSGVLSDFLRQLITLDMPDSSPSHQRRVGNRAGEKLAARLEEEILAGAVSMKPQPGSSYPAFFYRPEGWKRDLPLMRSSSMVSELAPVVLYLRDVVQVGDTLIIEEPEAHLHPAKQVEFMRSLAAVVQAGIRVLMTTHSEWVLEELANLVRASALSDARRKSVGDGGVSLRPEDVGAWLFQSKRRPKGSVVQEIPLDSASNLYPAGYDDVAFELHNRGVKIDSLAEADVAA